MSDIKETVEVDAPYSTVLDSLERRFRTQGHRLQLLVPLRDLGLPIPLGLEQQVDVEFDSRKGLKGQAQLYDEIDLSWKPTGGGIYPHFNGGFALRPLGLHTEVTLQGSYDPPLGIVGDAFDALVGRKIAQATVRALVEDVKKWLETDFQTVRETIEERPKRE